MDWKNLIQFDLIKMIWILDKVYFIESRLNLDYILKNLIHDYPYE